MIYRIFAGRVRPVVLSRPSAYQFSPLNQIGDLDCMQMAKHWVRVNGQILLRLDWPGRACIEFRKEEAVWYNLFRKLCGAA